jgi:pyridoxamine 5'-phosphate oxidase
MDLGNLRNEYVSSGLKMTDLPENPIQLFERWLTLAIESGEPEPNAMVLSTFHEDGFPDARVVLLKSTENNGFAFFTNYFSRKGISIDSNNNVSLVFFWPGLKRQVRVRGTAEKTADGVSDQYFASRPVESRIGAWASAQSTELFSRDELDEKYQIFKEFFEGKPIPRPEHWGGYIIKPMAIEFWQGRENRLHDRYLYENTSKGWSLKMLAP